MTKAVTTSLTITSTMRMKKRKSTFGTRALPAELMVMRRVMEKKAKRTGRETRRTSTKRTRETRKNIRETKQTKKVGNTTEGLRRIMGTSSEMMRNKQVTHPSTKTMMTMMCTWETTTSLLMKLPLNSNQQKIMRLKRVMGMKLMSN